jgi:hypothetical protein
MCSLIPHTSEKGMCGSSKMKTRSKWQVHRHRTNKSIAQAKQCKWLTKLKPTLNHKFSLDSLHSHGLHLKQRYHLPPYDIFCNIEMVFFARQVRVLKFPNYEYFNFVISFFSHELQLKSFQFQSYNLWWNLSSVKSQTSITSILDLIS